MNHQEPTLDAASVHFRPSISGLETGTHYQIFCEILHRSRSFDSFYRDLKTFLFSFYQRTRRIRDYAPYKSAINLDTDILMLNVICYNLYDGEDADDDDVMLTQVAPFKHGSLKHGSRRWQTSPQNPSTHRHRNADTAPSLTPSCGTQVPSLRHGELWHALNEEHFSPDQPGHHSRSPRFWRHAAYEMSAYGTCLLRNCTMHQRKHTTIIFACGCILLGQRYQSAFGMTPFLCDS